MISISRQLRRYFIIVTAIAVLIIFILSNIGMTIFFNSYVKEKDLKSDQKIVQYFQNILENDDDSMMSPMSGAMQFIRGEGAEVKLFDASGSLIFDTLNMGNMYGGMWRMQGMGGMGRGSGISDEPQQLAYQEYPILVQGKTVAKVQIGREKTILAAAEDRAFFLTMNLVYVLSLGLAIILSLVISKYVTGKFLKPLLIVKNNILSIKTNSQEKLHPVVSNAAEIEELVLATEELSQTIAEQDKLRKRLTSDIAHELRTPIATLQSHLEAMIDGVWEPTPQRLSNCYDELIRLTRLINDLNELSVLENDKIKLHITNVNLSDLLIDMLENFKPIFMEKDIELGSNIQPGIEIEGDNDRLRQIFVNILSNANKYTPVQGKVTVNLSAQSRWVVAEIIDTGIGISREDLPHIFQRFYRGDISRSRMSGGAGIGLTITKALIEAHHGSIEVESELGVGTRVKIYFARKDLVQLL